MAKWPKLRLERDDDTPANRSALGSGQAPKRSRFPVAFWIGFLLFWLALQFVWNGSATTTLPYSDFLARLRAGQIQEVHVADRAISGSFKGPDKDGHVRFEAGRVDPAIAAELDRYHVRFSQDAGGGWLAQLLSWIAPILLWGGLWWFLMRGMAAQGAGGLPVTEALAGTVLALPMHSYLDEATQDRIIAAVRGFNG